MVLFGQAGRAPDSEAVAALICAVNCVPVYSPSTPALSKRTLPDVPLEMVVVPTAILPAAAVIVQVLPRVQV